MNTQSLKQNAVLADFSAIFAWLWPKALAGVTALWASCPAMALIFVGMAVLDAIAGWAAAHARGECQSSKVRPAAWAFAACAIAVAAGYLVDLALGLGPIVTVLGYNIGPSFGAGLAGIFVLESFTSILENVRRSGRGKSPRFRKLFDGLKAFEGDSSK